MDPIQCHRLVTTILALSITNYFLLDFRGFILLFNLVYQLRGPVTLRIIGVTEAEG